MTALELHWLLRIGLVSLLANIASAAWATPILSPPILDPKVIVDGEQTAVRVAIEIREPSLKKGSVSLLEVDDQGQVKSRLGSLNDKGKNPPVDVKISLWCKKAKG